MKVLKVVKFPLIVFFGFQGLAMPVDFWFGRWRVDV